MTPAERFCEYVNESAEHDELIADWIAATALTVLLIAVMVVL